MTNLRYWVVCAALVLFVASILSCGDGEPYPVYPDLEIVKLDGGGASCVNTGTYDCTCVVTISDCYDVTLGKRWTYVEKVGPLTICSGFPYEWLENATTTSSGCTSVCLGEDTYLTSSKHSSLMACGISCPSGGTCGFGGPCTCQWRGY